MWRIWLHKPSVLTPQGRGAATFGRLMWPSLLPLAPQPGAGGLLWKEHNPLPFGWLEVGLGLFPNLLSPRAGMLQSLPEGEGK